VAERLRDFHARTGFLYLRKWAVVSIATGIVAGVGALALIQGIDFFARLFLETLVEYTPPLPGGDSQTHMVTFSIGRPWLIPVSTAIGGMISGLIVAKLAPEAKGVGTDAAIGEFHKGHALIRTRVPPVELLTSVITIGSGETSFFCDQTLLAGRSRQHVQLNRQLDRITQRHRSSSDS
jgi:CIC family chloride channel protein